MKTGGSNVVIASLRAEGYGDGSATSILVMHSDVVVCNCYATGGKFGIEVYFATATDARVLIYGNRCVDNVTGGIYTNGARYVVIYGNMCTQPTITTAEYGIGSINASHAAIIGNYVEGFYNIGIQLYYNPYSIVKGNITRKNAGTGDQSGITIDNSSYSIIEGNIAEENGLDGIYLEDSSYCGVVDNVARKNGRFGVQLFRSTTTPKFNAVAENVVAFNDNNGINLNQAVGNRISGNLCVNNSQVAGESGIALWNPTGGVPCTDNVLAGNICTDDQVTKTQDYGIRELADADYNIIHGNNCRGNAIAGITTVGVNTLVADNIT